MRGHLGWRLFSECTCHFMFPVFSLLSPSSYFLLLHSWFLIPFFKKSMNSSRHPWCPLVPISWIRARLYCFFFSFQPFWFFFLVAPASFCGDGDFHQRKEELCPCSVCHRRSSIFNQKCICLKGAPTMCVNVWLKKMSDCVWVCVFPAFVWRRFKCVY